MNFLTQPGGKACGEIAIPGDKSVSHRSIIFGSLAEGVTEVEGFLTGEDCLATLNAFRAMGVRIDGPDDGRLTIHGVGVDGLSAPEHALDLGNSGTSMRLMSGLLAAQSFDSVLTGDESLSGRPMRRVTEPLSRMGARIETNEAGTAPLRISGGQRLSGLQYESPVASAQIKSALLLAGIYADGETVVSEPGISRDHSERMFETFGYPINYADQKVSIVGGQRFTATALTVPRDLSSAAFFLVAASIAEDSEIVLPAVGVNPTRTGVLDVLRLMGADIAIENERLAGGEPIADLRVRSAALHGIDIPEALVPLAIDEFPALFIAAACAEGRTTLTGAAELRVKESDRIQVMADGLNAVGVAAQATDDGIIIDGGPIKGGKVHSHHDHRIAMSFAIAGLRADGPIEIEDCDNVATSFPGFVDLAQQAGLRISVA